MSPSDMGHSAKAMREEQLGKVRDNLLVSYVCVYINVCVCVYIYIYIYIYIYTHIYMENKVRDNLLVSHRMYSLSIEGFLSI